MIKYKGVQVHSFIFLWKIVLVGSFCTSRRIASSSHRLIEALGSLEALESLGVLEL